MANKHYLSGRRKEYQAMEKLRNDGYEVSRSAGSHGVWDVVAVGFGITRLIQVKSNCKISNEDLSQFKKLSCGQGTIKEVWTYEKGNKTPMIEKYYE